MSKTLSEQVAELEAREEALMKQVQRCIDERNGFLDGIAKANQARTAAAESALAQARVEGAREALTRLQAYWADIESHTTSSNIVAKNIAAFRDREYPAVPPEREGARTCDCGHDTSDHYGYDAGKRGCVANQMQCACDDFRPTPPQAAPEPREVKVGRVTFAFQKARGGVWCDDQDNTSGDLVALLYLHRLTPTADEYAALLALASRPTASGEG